MDRVFQGIFIDPLDHSTLEYDGTWVDGRWRDGWLRSSGDAIWPVRAGIPDFVRNAIDGGRWTYAAAKAFLDNGQYRRNWTGQNGLFGDTTRFATAVRRVVEGNEPIIDVATGPGGGAMPFILQLRPDAHVLAVDVGTPVLHGWHEYLAAEQPATRACFAGLDFTLAPFRGDSVSVLTSIGGFSNIIDQSGAWREAARVLRPGGQILAFEVWWDPEGSKRLAEALADPQIAPDGGLSVRDRIEAAGLTIVDEATETGRPLRADDNELAAKAVRLGIEIWIRFGKYVITKK